MANWKRYPSLAECIKDYARIINTLSWYKDALPYVIGPADEFLKNILPEPGEPGWATDPAYFYKIKKVAAEIASLGGPKWI
jgi:flagellum-specific peptidoglycan hydrolase FlgJ